MSFALDARVPVIFGRLDQAGPGDAVLVEGEALLRHLASAGFQVEEVPREPGHAPGCVCCVPRCAAGRALAGLLQDRARGRVAFFTRVIAVTETPAGRAAVEAALAADPVASACFRPAG
jgi:hypothetical protein